MISPICARGYIEAITFPTSVSMGSHEECVTYDDACPTSSDVYYAVLLTFDRRSQYSNLSHLIDDSAIKLWFKSNARSLQPLI